EKADRHLFIRPGTDAVLLLAMIHELFAQKQVRLGRLAATGLDELKALTTPWTPERAAEITGVAAADIRELAMALATTERAVLSAPGGPALEDALGQLDFMVSIDPYLNETTRFAHVILPPTSPLERAHYDAALNAFAVRNVAKYSPPLFERGDHERHDWEICL